ncbi:MAG: DUF488 domain-containing protein [Chloroflexota bacterium]|nr:MAG: hypothetical protein DIU68_19630 [Chloroflexota bacterium]
MYLRRKVLLGLVEAFGGRLTATDCHKLMFLLCQRASQNYYDFFPHKYGAYSLTLAQDKIRLTTLGFLAAGDVFQLRSEGFLSKLDQRTQSVIRSLVAEYDNTRGSALLKKVYVDYPYFAIKSQVAQQILSARDFARVTDKINTDNSPCLFTIGYEGITIDRYLEILINNNVAALVDVRKNPISKKYGFSKSQLQKAVQIIEIDYIHLPELGVPSHLRVGLNTKHDYETLFEYYDREVLPARQEALSRLRSVIFEKERVALTCFEASPFSCHRHRIAHYFEQDSNLNVPIVHLKA